MSPDASARERLVESFSRLAQTDSPSGREGDLAKLLIGALQQLGWGVVDDGTGPDCGNIIGVLPGDESLEPLMFTSHMDVVMPCLGVRPRLENAVFVSGGDTVLGADAKASVAALLELARMLPETSWPRPTVELVFTWGEEVGHLGARALDIKGLRSRRAYVLDGLAPVGTIIIAAPTVYGFTARVIGRAAHAGVEPERGISAISVAAQALTRLPWGRLDASTTANVGIIQGGSVRNAVPAEVQLEGELRSLVSEHAGAVARTIVEVFESVAAEAGARVEMDMRQRYAGYELDPRSEVVRLASDAFAGLANGGPTTLLRTGGGSDANELNVRGVTSCVLGIGAEGCHSVDERISMSQLELLSQWALEIVRQAARR